jgi:simple sugar transport system permease protein
MLSAPNFRYFEREDMQRPIFERVRLSQLSTPLVFVIAIIIFSVFSPGHRFLDLRNLGSMAKLAPDMGIVTLGIGILMIAGEFDLSIASVLPFCSFIFAQTLILGINPFIGLILTIVAGAVFGLVNGVIVVKTRLPSFIITLSTMLFWRGLLYGISHMMPISTNKYMAESPFFKQFLVGEIGPVPVQILWLLLFAVILGLMLHRTWFGNWIYATGSNEDAARAMGINVEVVKTACYVLVGMLAAWAAVMQSVRLGSFAATQGIGFELKSIAAVVVGGTALTGGVGSMVGIFLGVFIIQILENGLILMQVPVFGVEVFIGAAVILFVILNNYTNRQAIRQGA